MTVTRLKGVDDSVLDLVRFGLPGAETDLGHANPLVAIKEDLIGDGHTFEKFRAKERQSVSKRASGMTLQVIWMSFIQYSGHSVWKKGQNG